MRVVQSRGPRCEIKHATETVDEAVTDTHAGVAEYDQEMAHKRRRSRRPHTNGPLRDAGRLERRANWAVIVGLPIAVATLAVAIVALSDHGDRAVAQKVDLEDVALTVYNGVPGERVRGTSGEPELEVTLHNVGNQLSVARSVRIKVQEVAVLKHCYSAGVMPLGGRYGITLPASLTPGQVVEVPIHEQLAAEEADRFKLPISVVGRAAVARIYLLRLGVSLLHDIDRRPLPLGGGCDGATHDSGWRRLLPHAQTSHA